jgi:TonB family protein
MHRKLRLYFSICCAVACAAASPIRAQENAQASAYLEQAAAGMLQRTAGNPPFHLTATFTLVKPEVLANGTTLVGDGTYDETWVDPNTWRKEVTVGGYHLILIHKGNDMWRLGVPQGKIKQLFRTIIPDVAIPLFREPPPAKATDVKWDVSTVKLGPVEVIRVGDAIGKPVHGKRSGLDNSYYFDPATNALIMRSSAPFTFDYTSGGKILGKFVALDGTVSDFNGLIARFHITSLSANPKVNEADFVPTADFKLVNVQQIPLPQKLSGADPIFPAEARGNHISGTVVIALTIEPDGSTSDFRVLSGPPELVGASVQSVSTWRFKPPIIDGVPVEAETIVRCNFNFGN